MPSQPRPCRDTTEGQVLSLGAHGATSHLAGTPSSLRPPCDHRALTLSPLVLSFLTLAGPIPSSRVSNALAWASPRGIPENSLQATGAREGDAAPRSSQGPSPITSLALPTLSLGQLQQTFR